MMNNNSFIGHNHFPSPHNTPSSFYDSLLSLEKFIDKKHAFDDFAHLVFKSPVFEDLIAVVSVYTSSFGPMTDREVAMVQKRMYQLNRQTVRAMHEIINQKQLIAGINSKDGTTPSSLPKTPLSNNNQQPSWMNTTPLPAYNRDWNGDFGRHDMPSMMHNTPMQTPLNSNQYYGGLDDKNNSNTMDSRDFQLNDSMTIQDLLRMQENFAKDLVKNAGSMRTPNPLDILGAHSHLNSAADSFMTPPSPPKMPPMIISNDGIVGDLGKARSTRSSSLSNRRRLLTE